MSSEMPNPRSYTLRRRAERQEATRQRIVDAAVELHTTLGPAQTSVQAIAERAGVTRPTVYAHFPDARSLLMACSGHVTATMPPPEPSGWVSIADPAERLAVALRAMYAYYERQEQLLDNVQRDVAVMPVLAEVSAFRTRYLREAPDVLLRGWPVRGAARARLRRAIGHALEFRTWQSLVRRQGCSTAEAVELMVALAERAASGPPASRSQN
jgi:AcrR family transcriptional regulator